MGVAGLPPGISARQRHKITQVCTQAYGVVRCVCSCPCCLSLLAQHSLWKPGALPRTLPLRVVLFAITTDSRLGCRSCSTLLAPARALGSLSVRPLEPARAQQGVHGYGSEWGSGAAMHCRCTCPVQLTCRV